MAAFGRKTPLHYAPRLPSLGAACARRGCVVGLPSAERISRRDERPCQRQSFGAAAARDASSRATPTDVDSAAVGISAGLRSSVSGCLGSAPECFCEEEGRRGEGEASSCACGLGFVEFREEGALSRQCEALRRFVRQAQTVRTCASLSSQQQPRQQFASLSPADVVFLRDKARDAIRGVQRRRLSPSTWDVGRRAAVVDLVMSFAAELQKCFGAAEADMTRSAVQLAVSLLDRSCLLSFLESRQGTHQQPQENGASNSTPAAAAVVAELNKGEEEGAGKAAERLATGAIAGGCNPSSSMSLRSCAAFCLLMALQFEAPNSVALEGRLKQILQVEALVSRAFGMSYRELQKIVLDSLHCQVTAPLPSDFADFFLRTASRKDEPFPLLTASSVELVFYLLDCFALTPESTSTPACLAGAAAVQLARRIMYGGMPAQEVWPPTLQQLTGFSRSQARTVFRALNFFLPNKAGRFPGLKQLHAKGWAAVEWEPRAAPC